MATSLFNQSFYGSNNVRSYVCLPGSSELPSAIISDLKITTPSTNENLYIDGITSSEQSVRVLISNNVIPVLSFSDNNRRLLRTNTPYKLKSLKDGYYGFIVFGDSIKNDTSWSGTAQVSEECITRYKASKIPYVAKEGATERLTGYVKISGGASANIQVQSVTDETYGATTDVLVISLNNTGSIQNSNPQILFANGINSVNEHPDKDVMPVSGISGVSPDCDNTITFSFSDRFKLGLIQDESTGNNIGLTVEIDITPEEICESKNAADTLDVEEYCEDGTITWEVVEAKKCEQP